MHKQSGKFVWFLLTWIFLFTLQPAFGAYIRYGGFTFTELRPYQQNKNNTAPILCLSILEISPYQRRNAIYRQEEFISLVENKPEIANHIQSHLKVDIQEFIHFLERRDLKNNCVSDSLIYEFFTLHNFENPKKHPKIRRGLSTLRVPSGHFGPSLWSDDVFDQFIIRRYSDPLEEADKRWQGEVDGEKMSGFPSPEKFMFNAQKFLANYMSLGVIKKIKVTKYSEVKPKEGVTFFPGLDYIRDRVCEKREASWRKKVEGYAYHNYLRRISTDSFSHFQHNTRLWEEKYRDKIDKIKSVIKIKEALSTQKKHQKNHAITEYESLRNRKKSGHLKKDEKQRYRDLKAEIEFGIRPREYTALGKFRRNIKKAVKFYNIFGTDTLVDKFMDNTFRLTIKQLLPMSKKRYAFYRISKGLDGFFVLSVTIAGLCGIPFTGGLSLLASGAINVATTGFFSILTSATRNEPWDSNIYRLGLRSAHTFGESFVPVWTEFNGLFTAIDDIRVATSLDQLFSRLVKKNNQAIKVRPESLGKPVILSLLRERINYLNRLVSDGEKIEGQVIFNQKQQKYFEKTFFRLLQTRFQLEKYLIKSVFRYEQLLEMGKIPDHMLFDVRENLKKLSQAANGYFTPAANLSAWPQLPDQ